MSAYTRAITRPGPLTLSEAPMLTTPPMPISPITWLASTNHQITLLGGRRRAVVEKTSKHCWAAHITYARSKPGTQPIATRLFTQRRYAQNWACARLGLKGPFRHFSPRPIVRYVAS